MLNKFLKKKYLKAIIFSLLLVLVIIVFYQRVEFSSSDLGRHLENGRLIFLQPEILSTNFYSYTETNYPFINHHWAAGFIYFIIFSLGGFKLLSIFNIILALSIFSVFFIIAKRRSNFMTASLLSLPIIFLLSARVEPRPELFSYLFLGITWLAIESKKLSDRKRLIILLPLFILWANTHIYFFMGLALIFFAIIDRLIGEGVIPFKLNKVAWQSFFKKAQLQIFSFFVVVLACAFNPNHFKALFYPLNILRKYGYQIAENKSIFFLSDFSTHPNYLLFKLLLLLLALSLLANFFLLKRKSYTDYLFAVFISLLALLFSRNVAIFSLAAFVIIAPSVAHVLGILESWLDYALKNKFKLTYWRDLLKVIYIIILVSALIFFISDLNKRQLFLHQESGLGLSAGSLEVFEYFRKEELKGPIFNNYDAGSAINFGLLGAEKVFVDNRPEAYSVSFFEDVYVPMQESRDEWNLALEKYKFNTILFSHKDSTPWAKTFVSNILQDDKWALVYFDSYYLVMVNKDSYSEEFIAKKTIGDNFFVKSIREMASVGSLNIKFSLANFSKLAGYDYLAKEIYQKILLDYPSKQRVLFELASLYSKGSSGIDLNQALKYYETGQNSGLLVPAIYREMGLIAWRLKDYSRAEDYFKKSARNGNKNSKDYLRQIKKLRKDSLIP